MSESGTRFRRGHGVVEDQPSFSLATGQLSTHMPTSVLGPMPPSRPVVAPVDWRLVVPKGKRSRWAENEKVAPDRDANGHSESVALRGHTSQGLLRQTTGGDSGEAGDPPTVLT
jgi:hypothetical protein